MRALILALILFVAVTCATDVKQCKKGQPFPLSVKVMGCEQSPCDVVKGSTAVMLVHFVGSSKIANKLTAKVRATTIGITVPYELPEEVANVCQNLMHGARCPIYATEDVVYQFNFYIDSSYPEISVKVEVSLDDENKESNSCFVIDVKVKKGSVPKMLA